MIERNEILKYALVGYQAQREEIEQRIADVQRRLNGAAAPPMEQEKPKRRLSAKGRRAIVKATTERWRRARAAGRKRLG
jgi:hypothetical protein